MTRVKWMLLALLALQVLDAVSTRLALRVGAWELNPLIHMLGLWPSKLLVMALCIVLVVRNRRPWRLAIPAVIYIGIITSNFVVYATHAH